MRRLLGDKETAVFHWSKWASLSITVLAALFSLIAAIGFLKLSSVLDFGTSANEFYPFLAFGLVSASLAVIALVTRMKQPVFVVARWVTAASALGVALGPQSFVQLQGPESDPVVRWVLAVSLAVIATSLFTFEKSGRMQRASATTLICLAGLAVPTAKFVDGLFSLLQERPYGSLVAMPTVAALSISALLITVLLYIVDSSKSDADRVLTRVLRLRTVFIAAALATPVTIQIVRILASDVTGHAQSSTDLVMTVVLMAGFATLVWFGFKVFIKRELQIIETRSSLERFKARYASALNNARIGVWDRDVQSNELHWSERIASLFGYESGELETSHENFMAAVHPDDRQKVIDAVNVSLYEGAEYDIEHRVVWPDGTVRWMHERGDVQRDEDGTPLNVIGVVEDVTDKKIALMRLAQSEAKYEAVVLNVPGVVYRIIVVDGKPEFEFISPSGNELLEIDRAVQIDFSLLMSMVHPDDLARMKESILDRDNMGTVTWTGRLIVADKVKWIESRSRHFVDKDGRFRVDGVVYDITDKVETTKMLTASEARFERLADNMPGMLYQVVHAPDGVVSIPYVSSGVEEIFGLTPEEIIADHNLLNESIHPDDLKRHREEIALALQNQTDFVWTGRTLRQDGEQRYIQVSCKTSTLEDGTVIWDGMIIDVSGQKQVEEDLKVTRDRLADLLSSSPTVIYACETESPYALNYISENVSEHLGFDPEECLSQADYISSRTHPDDRDAEQSAIDEIEETGHSVLEYRLKNKEGEYRWIRDEMRFVVRPDKREIVGSLIDITARKEAEDALRLSEERFRAMSGASPLGIFMADERGDIIYVNSKMTDVLMVGHERLYGDSWTELVHSEDRVRVTSVLAKSINGETPFAIECRLVRADGNLIWCSLKAAPMFDHGALIGFVGTVEDITERYELEIESEQARIEAERANQAKSEFLSRMSHELRTPLNAILGYAQLLEMDPGQKDPEPLVQILKGGRHLLSLINEVLDIARIESGDLGIEFEPIRIKHIVDEVVLLLQPIAHERAVAIEVKIDQDDMTYVLADPQRLKQVILNVLSNAVKYNKPEGFVTIMVEPVSDHSIEIIIKDTGKGIASDKLFRLFTPFDRLGAEGTPVEGSGLGLALTHRLLAAMDGRIEIDSEEGVGTVARIRLKLAANPELSLNPLRSIADVTGDGKGKSARILLIEDNESNIRLMETIFSRRSHYHLDVAMTGSLGIDLAQKHRPDLILLDVNLPDSIGTNVIERIKSDPILKDTDVIVISADANKKQVERFRKAGAIAYLTKPVNVGELLRLVDGVLDSVETHD